MIAPRLRAGLVQIRALFFTSGALPHVLMSPELSDRHAIRRGTRTRNASRDPAIGHPKQCRKARWVCRAGASPMNI
jgi:hypothetical protein